MSNFDQRQYNLLYNNAKRTHIRVNVSNEEKDMFDAYCTKIGIKSSTYIKMLINADMQTRGDNPLFNLKSIDKG